jgi:hypothetical protein
MIQLGIEAPPPLLPETPYVLNALAEGRLDNPDEMNPGMIRGVELRGTLPVADYPPSRRAECRALLEEAVRTGNDERSPAAVRAAWLLHVVGEIHPFGDGNGRVVRLLYLLVTGAAMPRTVDWGVVEQLRYHQDTWSNTLKERDVTPCAIATTELSISGARLMLARLDALGRLIEGIQRPMDLSEGTATHVLAVWLRRVARLDDLAADLDQSYENALVESERMVQLGILQRHHQSDQPLPRRPSYALSPYAEASLRATLNNSVRAGADTGRENQ